MRAFAAAFAATLCACSAIASRDAGVEASRSDQVLVDSSDVAFDTTETHTPPELDAAETDAGIDSSTGDAICTSDVPPFTMFDAVTTMCDPVVEIPPPPRSPGPCDGPALLACREWAASAAGELTGYAICSAGTTCQRASDCTLGPETCRCGCGPQCLVGEVCASDTPDGVPYCHCTQVRDR